MSTRAAAFFTDEALARAKRTVEAVEAHTSCEIVLSAEPRADRYLWASMLFGFLCATVVLLLLLFLPQPFDHRLFPVDTTVAFLLGAYVCHRAAWLQRLLVPKTMRRMAVERLAKSLFVDLNITATHARNGIFVLVALAEGETAVVYDFGIDTAALGPPLQEIERAMEQAALRRDADAFFSAVERLGPVLGEKYPRQEDDINELPDEMVRL